MLFRENAAKATFSLLKLPTDITKWSETKPGKSIFWWDVKKRSTKRLQSALLLCVYEIFRALILRVLRRIIGENPLGKSCRHLSRKYIHVLDMNARQNPKGRGWIVMLILQNSYALWMECSYKMAFPEEIESAEEQWQLIHTQQVPSFPFQ